MALNVIQNIKEAVGSLNPQEMREHADRPVRVFLYADDDYEYRTMEEYFAPPHLSVSKRAELIPILYRASEDAAPSAPHDLEIYFDQSRPGVQRENGDSFAFDPERPEQTIEEVLERRRDLAIPLARYLLPFREPVSRRVIKKISRENALFALATALPDIVPFLSLPWAIGEFASDTAFLTANQIRMAFFLAAAADREIGYREQRGEIGSIVLGAFGWRALARELVGKIPLGGGLIPKAAIAYAGTRVVGLSLERYFRLGYGYSRAERRVAYAAALDKGKALVASVIDNVRQQRQARAS